MKLFYVRYEYKLKDGKGGEGAEYIFMAEPMLSIAEGKIKAYMPSIK